MSTFKNIKDPMRIALKFLNQSTPTYVDVLNV